MKNISTMGQQMDYPTKGTSYFLVNEGTTFGIIDADGQVVVDMIDAVNRPQLSKDIKRMFKTVYEYSLYQEKTQQRLYKNLQKALSNFLISSPEAQHRFVLRATLYDFVAQCCTLDETKELFLNILTDDFVGLHSPFQKENKERPFHANAIIRLIDILNDDEWFIHFFTNYINEITANFNIKNADWEECLVRYLIDVVAKGER
jgi:hypothetical protein